MDKGEKVSLAGASGANWSKKGMVGAHRESLQGGRQFSFLGILFFVGFLLNGRAAVV